MSDVVVAALVAALVTGIFGIIVALISAFVLYRIAKVEKIAMETHVMVNSHMEELLKLVRASGVAQGVAEERERAPLQSASQQAE